MRGFSKFFQGCPAFMNQYVFTMTGISDGNGENADTDTDTFVLQSASSVII